MNRVVNHSKRIVKNVHIPLHLMKPVRPKELVMCLCEKCMGYDIQVKKPVIVASEVLPETRPSASDYAVPK